MAGARLGFLRSKGQGYRTGAKRDFSHSHVTHKVGGLFASRCSKRKLLLSSEALQEPTTADAGEIATPNFGEFPF
jgi:hypothetical protein